MAKKQANQKTQSQGKQKPLFQDRKKKSQSKAEYDSGSEEIDSKSAVDNKDFEADEDFADESFGAESASDADEGVNGDDGSDHDEEKDDEDVETYGKPLVKRKAKPGTFQAMNLSEPILRAILKKGYRLPTPIQRKTIPILLTGVDIVAMARTGSGKTAAFLVPMMEKLKRSAGTAGIRGLVLSPTRELTFQTLKFCRDLAKFTDLRSCSIVGGDSMDDQFEELSRNPDILIATPGRLLHLMSESAVSLNKIEYVVFDEADRLFEMGFQEQLMEILQKLPSTRQTAIFSATLPQSLVDFAKAGLQTPEVVRLDTDTKLSENLKISFYTCRVDEKSAALLYLLKSVIPADDLTIVFTATKHHVEYLHALLAGAHIDAAVVYGSLDMTARKINVAKFRNGKSKVMIVTDVAARGIDIPLLNNVINYDFPCKSKLFVHRVGRAARAGRSGVAYSLVSPDELPYMIDLHLYLGRPLLYQRPSGTEPAIDTNVYYGEIPQFLIDLETESIKSIFRENSDMESLKKVTQNAYKLYHKTRSLPSSESVRRAKELPKNQIHPDLLLVTDATLQTQANFIAKMKGFRPSQTIFEYENCGKRKTKSLEILNVMRNKRTHDEHIIESEKKKRSLFKMDQAPSELVDEADAARPDVFRDQQFYIPLRPSNEATEKSLSLKDDLGKKSDRIEDLVLDMVPDERDSLVLNQKRKQWDRKKKKFVTVEGASSKKAMIRTESGTKVGVKDKSKGNRFEAWKEKQKKKTTPTPVDKGPKDLPKAEYKSRKSELKSKDQIRKDRKVQAKRASWLKFKKSGKGK